MYPHKKYIQPVYQNNYHDKLSFKSNEWLLVVNVMYMYVSTIDSAWNSCYNLLHDFRPISFLADSIK